MRTPEDRFWDKVRRGDKCWLWVGARSSTGYGQIAAAGRLVYAHRFAYELLVGDIPETLQIDHLCRNRACVNPDHMEAVTQRVNILRGESTAARNAAKTHCRRGHPFDEANTIHLSRGGRQCRTCHSERERGADKKLRTRSGRKAGDRSRKLDAATAEQIRLLRDEGLSYRRLALRFGVASSTIEAVVTGRTWKDAA